MKKKNLLLLGASGGVSNAFLHYLTHHRNIINKLILLDKSDAVKTDPYIDHKVLNYTFLHKEIDVNNNSDQYLKILSETATDIVLDLTDVDSIPIIDATNKAGISYINTALNSEPQTVTDLVYNVYPRKNNLNNNVHILCTGMNPGVVNMWVRFGIEKYGVPKQILHFEYDTSMMATGFRSMVTWSIKEFLVESFRDPSGVALGKDQVKNLMPNGITHKINMKKILSPIMKLNKYPYGFPMLHEENLTIAQKYNIPSKFIYAVHPKTMAFMEKKFKEKGKITKEDFVLADNTSKILEGADNIGVILDYGHEKVYYFNSAPNIAAIGTNGTYTQVIVGVFASLFTLLFDKPANGAYFVEDLWDSHYKYYLFDNMRVQEFMFKKKKDEWKIGSYNPQIKLRRMNHFEHLYI